MRATTESSWREPEPGTMPDGRREASRRRSQLLRWAQRLLVRVDTAMLAWSAWVLVDASRSQDAARQSLASVSSAPSAPLAGAGGGGGGATARCRQVRRW